MPTLNITTKPHVILKIQKYGAITTKFFSSRELVYCCGHALGCTLIPFSNHKYNVSTQPTHAFRAVEYD
jgi:hypothetical protein